MSWSALGRIDGRRPTRQRAWARRAVRPPDRALVGRAEPGVGIDEITELFLAAMLTPDTTTAEKLQKIGAVALSTDTVTEACAAT